MIHVRMVTILLLLALLAPAGAPAAQSGPAVSQTPTASGLLFVENAGQFDPAARFQVWGGGQTLWLAEDAVWMTVVERANVRTLARFTPEPENVQRQAANLRISFPGANPRPRLEPFDRLDTLVSYFLGSDPTGWRPDVPVWGGVRYVDLYPGVDLEVTGEGGQIAPRLAARPGADLAAVRLRVEGADEVTVEGDDLRLSTAAGEAILPLLTVEGANVERSNVERANASAFDVTAPFTSAHAGAGVANPQSTADNPADLRYGTYLGGTGYDSGVAIAVDAAGSAYVTGVTESGDFPTTPGAFDTSHNGDYDVFVVKLDPTGSRLTYATFLGGSSIDLGYGIAVDRAGNAYVTGYTYSYSSDFPTTSGAFDTSYNGGWVDAFVVKLDPDGGTLAYATFLGGRETDIGYSIAVDGVGSAYVTGVTSSNDFPVTSDAFDTGYNGGPLDAFVVKLNPAGSALAYATFLGGSNDDRGYGIAAVGAGNAYVTGRTGSSDFPVTPGAFDTSYSGGDAFVVKLNQAGSGLTYTTFLGGRETDVGYGIAVDAAGSAYVTGATSSNDFPVTPGAFDTSYSGGDAFVAKLNPAGSALAYATFLGGRRPDEGYAIAVDAAGRACVTGRTESSDFRTTPGAFDTSYNGGQYDAFAAKLDPTGDALAYATFLGGYNHDSSYGIAVDGSGSAYVTGETLSSDFPTTPGAFDTNYNGSAWNGDAFAAKLLARPLPPPPLILGAIWHDLDADATKDAGEPGIAGIQVCAEPLGHRPIRCATSGPDGTYMIDLDAAGTYLVAPSTAPEGMQLTTPGSRLPVVVREGQQVWDVDFGYR